MDVEIIFSGLASFVNIRNPDPKLTEPAVILVQTDDDGGTFSTPPHEHDHVGMPPMPGMPPPPSPPPGSPPAPPVDHHHIPFISYNIDEATVDNATGFVAVPNAPAHMYMPLDGVELSIQNDEPANSIRLDPSFDKLAQMELYWPASKGKPLNPAYVPYRGKKPTKKAVKAYLRFGSGELAAGQLALAAWVFFDEAGEVTLSGIFAEEIIYRDFKHSGHDIVMEMKDLETGEVVHKVRFSPLSRNQEKLTISIGNHMADDLDSAVRRKRATVFTGNGNAAGAHFSYLNAISSLTGRGALPKPVPIPLPENSMFGGGTTQGGPCGPGGG